MAQSPLRAKLRGKLLGLNNRRSLKIEVEIDSEKLNVEVREPTVADQKAILEAGGIGMAEVMAAGGDAARIKLQDPIKLFIECCLRCAYVAETGEPLFVPEDITDFENRPASDGTGWISTIAGKVLQLMNRDASEKKASSSPATANGSSSSELQRPPDSGTSMASPQESPSLNSTSGGPGLS
jgi:hypothetical protein